jgi:hypothetical protein
MGGGLEVGELRVGLDGLWSDEAAGIDEVVLHGESAIRGNERIRGSGRRCGGEEEVEMEDGGGQGRGEELG